MVERCVREWGGLRIDTRDWPVVLMDLPERRIEDSHLHEGLACLEQLLSDCGKSGTKTYQITDLTRMREVAPASQRKYAAEWTRRTLTLQRLASLGGANVTPSAILRGLITAIHWLQPPAMPTTFFATREEAYREAIRVFDAAGLPLPADVRARIDPAFHAPARATEICTDDHESDRRLLR